MSKPIVAIVGRPNVGKSTFFNRCVQEKHAIVDDTPGITRDRIYRETDWSGRKFLLVDTGGILPDEGKSFEPMAREVLEQVKEALEQADVVVFMVDAVTVRDRPEVILEDAAVQQLPEASVAEISVRSLPP